MNFAAVYHRMSDNMCYPLNEEDLIINIKTGYDVKQEAKKLQDFYIVKGTNNTEKRQ